MRRTRRLALAALLCAAVALLTAACATSESAARPDDPDPAADPTLGADPAPADATEADREAARMAATQSGPVGGEATKTGASPDESKLTDFDKLDINAILSDRRKELTSCYDDALAIVELPPDGFLVKAKFTIEADGTVKGAEVVEATQRFADAEQCFLMKLAMTTFPEPPQGRVIETTYPFTIKRKLKQ